MPKFISDQDMAALEGAQKTKRIISDAEMAQMEQQEAPEKGPGLREDIGAGLRSFADTASFGTYPYLVAGAEKGLQMIPGYGSDLPGMEGKPYGELVDAYKGKTKESQEGSPISSGVGMLSGIVGGGGLLAKAIPKAPIVGAAYNAIPEASMLGRAAKTGIAGGTAGLIQTPETGFSDVEARVKQAGTGAVIGAVAQPLLEGGAKLLGAAGKIPSMFKKPGADSGSGGGSGGGDGPRVKKIFDGGKKYSPQSLDEIADIVKDNPALKTIPSESRLNEIVNTLGDDLEYAPSKLHMEMSKDLSHKNIVNLIKKVPGEAENLTKYETLMKTEQQNKVGEFINKLGTREKLDPVQSGESFVNNINNKYEGVKKQLGPVFQDIENTRIAKQNHVPFLKDELLSVGKLNGRVGVDMDGNLVLKNFDPNMGITSNAYNSVKSVVDSINGNKNISLGDLKEYRSFLRDSINWDEPKSAAFLSEVRNKLLDHSEKLIQKYRPDLSVKGVSKAWARNEQFKEKVETIIKGDLDKIPPEQILKRVFSNTKNTTELKKEVGDMEFYNMTGDYLNQLVQDATDTAGQISSAKFATLLKKNKNIIENTLGNEEYKRLLARSDLMKLADAQSFNYSNTAPAQETFDMLKNPSKIPGKMLQGYMQNREAAEAKQQLNNLMSGNESFLPQEGLINKIGRIGSAPLKPLNLIRGPKPTTTGAAAGLLSK